MKRLQKFAHLPRGLLVGLLLAGQVTAVATPGAAWAVNPFKAAEAMAKSAAAAYEAGDFQRAADLYQAAHASDPGKADYLFAAARAAHVGGQLEAAERRYRAYLAHPQANPERSAKAQAYLGDLRAAQADQRAAEADKSLRTDNHALAVQQFLEAHALAPDRPALLFKAARAAYAGGDLDRAETLGRRYLEAAGPGAADEAEAQALLAQIARKRNPTSVPADPAGPAAGAGTAATTGQAAPTASNTGAAVTLAGGIALTLAGAGLYAWSRLERADLDAALAEKDAQGLVTGTTRDEALASKAAIEQHKTLGVAGLALGLAATAAGAWLWQRPAGQVAVRPGPGLVGLAVVWRR